MHANPKGVYMHVPAGHGHFQRTHGCQRCTRLSLREKGNGTKGRDTDSRDCGRRFSRLVRRLACTQVYIQRGAWGAQDFVFERNNMSYTADSVVVDKDKLEENSRPRGVHFPILTV